MMGNTFNAVNFYETFAQIVADREHVDIKVNVRRKVDPSQELPMMNGVRYRRMHKHVG